jgi:hypothetical protein
MKNIIQELLDHPEKIPMRVLVAGISDMVKFEERCHEVDRVFVNLIDWGAVEFEFCPDHEPPDVQTELLPWLWILYPELKDELKALGNDDLRQMIDEYEDDLEEPGI